MHTLACFLLLLAVGVAAAQLHGTVFRIEFLLLEFLSFLQFTLAPLRPISHSVVPTLLELPFE